jgi:hypothetical protein
LKVVPPNTRETTKLLLEQSTVVTPHPVGGSACGLRFRYFVRHGYFVRGPYFFTYTSRVKNAYRIVRAVAINVRELSFP